MKEKSRIVLLDVLRGFSICLVIIAHFGNELVAGLYEFQNHVWNIGVTGVFVFFCVSGYVIPFTIRKLNFEDGRLSRVSQFWIKRAFRLLPVYLVLLVPVYTTVLAGALDRKQQILDYLASQPIQYVAAICTFTGYFFDYPLPLGGLEWSLAYEVLFYVGCSIYIVAGFANHRNTLFSGVFIICFFVFLPGVGHLFHHHAFMLLFFVVGLLIYVSHAKVITSRDLAVLLLLVIGTIYSRALSWSYSWGVSYITIAALVAPQVFLIVMLYSKFPIGRRCFALLGLISYSLYLSHIIVMTALPLETMPPFLKFCTWLVGSVVLSTALFHIVESPANRLGHTLAMLVARRSTR